jgi:hypothetical protein
MKVFVLVVAAAVAAGCTSVKMVQRDGCWIKRTEKPFKRVSEEIGPCPRAQPKWVDDQLTRLVQECVAQADWRWQVRALDSWSRGKAYPAQPAQEETLRTCMQEARVGLVGENEDLKRRLGEVASARDEARTLADRERTLADQERTKLQESLDKTLDRMHDTHERLAGYLGEAANKPAAPAVATASATSTSDGKATNESGASLATEASSGSGSGASGALPPAVPAALPVAPATAAPAPAAATPAPAPAPASRPAKVARARRPSVAQAPPPAACDPTLAKAAAQAPCAVPAETAKAEGPRP